MAEFIDEMYERLLAVEGKTYGEAHLEVIKAKNPQKYVDLGRIENGYQLFRKRHPEAHEDSFRRFIKNHLPDDYERAQRLFKWKGLEGD